MYIRYTYFTCSDHLSKINQLLSYSQRRVGENNILRYHILESCNQEPIAECNTEQNYNRKKQDR